MRLFRILRYIIREIWYFLFQILEALRALPLWVKQLAIMCLFVWMIFWVVPHQWQEYQDYKRLYNYYYEYYYRAFSKKLPANEASYRADYYSNFYAKYYTSTEYKEALVNGLTEEGNVPVKYDAKAPNVHHVTNTTGVALIKHFEGYRDEPYLDVGGKLTIGYGHLVRQGEIFADTSKPAMEQLLRKDLKLAEAIVKRYVKVPLNSNQFSALVSLAYNIGIGQFRDSTLLEQLNKGRFDKAAQEFLRWNKVDGGSVRGLSIRREAERRLFLGMKG